jgi:hypothetical protein
VVLLPVTIFPSSFMCLDRAAISSSVFALDTVGQYEGP